MTSWLIRVLFFCAMGSVGYQVAKIIAESKGYDLQEGPAYLFWGIIIGAAASVVIMVLEALFSKRPIQSISAIMFGLVFGFLLAIVFYNVALLAIGAETHMAWGFPDELSFQRMLKLFLVVVCCYVGIAVIYKTRQNFRFIIPYVEFRREEQGPRPIVTDTSAIIDGRLAEICDTHVIDSPLLIPKFVLQELQNVADSPDRTRRARGRRGLEILNRLQRDQRMLVQIHDGRGASGGNVDSKLVNLASQLDARVLTCDYNLGRIAEVQGVEVININDLASALKPVKLPGEEVDTKILREGEEPGQGIGYLTDGTMVVVEHASDQVGRKVTLVVTNVHQTSAGRMIFGRLKEEA